MFSRLRSFLWTSPSARGRGFTLVELVISVAIIAVISAIVLMRFRVFDSTVHLKNIAYEVGSTIRDAQVYAVSVTNAGGGYGKPYGMYFNTADTSYTFCYADKLNGDIPYCDTNDATKTIVAYSFNQNIQIQDLCVTDGAGEHCTVNELHISFKRPEFTAYFHQDIGLTDEDIEQAKIKLYSVSDPTIIWVVEVGKLGQISVYKE